jgi:hypothetical protein
VTYDGLEAEPYCYKPGEEATLLEDVGRKVFEGQRIKVIPPQDMSEYTAKCLKESV